MNPVRTWRQLTPDQQREARDWWEAHEAVYAEMSDTDKLCSVFKETPMPPPWPQPPVDLRGVKKESLPDHDYTSVLVPDSVYDKLERGECFSDEEIDAICEEVSRFTGVPAKHFQVDVAHEFAEVILTLED